MKEHIVYLILGSNMGNRQAYLQSARDKIATQIGPITSVSAIFMSEPWGMVADTPFLNQALSVTTDLGPLVVLNTILNIEGALGRIRTGKRESRTIDIDIAFYDDCRIDSEVLTVPHPYITERNFALAPLADISPQLVHPILGKTVAELLAACPDHGEVTIFDPQ